MILLLGAGAAIETAAAEGPADRRAAPDGGAVLLPPAGDHIYRAANPGFGGPEDKVSKRRIRRFEDTAGAPIAWAYFSNNWLRGIRFPSRNIDTIRAAGRTPFVRLMARSGFREGGPDRRYTMASIIAGHWDDPSRDSDGLRRWCSQAAASGGPLLAEFGTEVNGDWFPWNGRWNGGGRRDRYGDPALPDGPERFRDAYRHIIDLCREEGADNITWFFHVDADGEPRRGWNRKLAAYYPGPSYIDWIGVSFYGSLDPRWDWEQLRAGLDRSYSDLVELAAHGDKPLALLEFGTREASSTPGRKARWITRALADVRHRYPELDAISWWNERWRDEGRTIDVRIDSSPSSTRAYRRGIRNPRFSSRLRFGTR